MFFYVWRRPKSKLARFNTLYFFPELPEPASTPLTSPPTQGLFKEPEPIQMPGQIKNPGTGKPSITVPPLTSNASLEDEEIEEDMEDFLNSSVSASEDFTKDETASEAASLRADFVDKLP